MRIQAAATRCCSLLPKLSRPPRSPVSALDWLTTTHWLQPCSPVPACLVVHAQTTNRRTSTQRTCMSITEQFLCSGTTRHRVPLAERPFDFSPSAQCPRSHRHTAVLCDAQKSRCPHQALVVVFLHSIKTPGSQKGSRGSSAPGPQLMTNSLRFRRRFSMAALRCRFRRHHITTIVATTDGTPIATPTPMATGLLMPGPPSLGEATTVGCWRRDRVSLRRSHLFKKLASSYWRTRPSRPWHLRRLGYAEERRLCEQRNFSPGPAHRPQLELIQAAGEPPERIRRPCP